MPASEKILNKIKLLKRLSASSNEYESKSAKELIDQLMQKYQVSDDELKSLEDKVPLYGEKEKIYTSVGIIPWAQQLVLCIGNYFDCQIVQVELVPAEGSHLFEYYAYGDPEAVAAVQSAYKLLFSKVNDLVQTKSIGKGPIYISSYAEGMVTAVKENISLYGLEIPQVVRTTVKTEKVVSDQAIEPQKKDRPKPAERRVDVNGQSVIGDIGAYFSGVYDGREISFDDYIETSTLRIE